MQKVKTLRCSAIHGEVPVVDFQDTGVPVRISVLNILMIRREHHHIRVSLWIDGFLVIAYVVGCIVNAKVLVFVHPIGYESNAAVFLL